MFQKYFLFSLDDVCKNALDLSKGTLNIGTSWKFGTYCQWTIPIKDDNSYVTLEFQDYDVSS